jgi:hypothetical protein
MFLASEETQPMKTKRTDPHRPGAIIPADYDCFGFFAYGGAYEPPFGMEIFTSPAVQAGGMVKIDRESGGCQVCGANYRFGVLFKLAKVGSYEELVGQKMKITERLESLQAAVATAKLIGSAPAEEATA